MKNTFLSLVITGMTITASHAQTRHCGTMEYYELRKQQDPSLVKRMDENEKQIAEWIKQHPDSGRNIPAKSVFPTVAGFKETDNKESDKINYANAKQKYQADQGVLYGKNIPADINKDKSLREEKRKSNSFITKN